MTRRTDMEAEIEDFAFWRVGEGQHYNEQESHLAYAEVLAWRKTKNN